MLKKLIPLILTLSGIAWCAPPDCQYSFKFTNRSTDQTDGITQISGANPAVAINNKDNACAGWQLSYDSEGFTAINLVFQSAPNTVNAPNVISPGAWSTFSGTAVTGSLPLTNTASGLYIGYNYFPWVRVNLTSLTGTGSINVKLQGWKSVAYVAGISSGGGGSGCSPLGNAGDIQMKNGSNCAASALNDNGTDVVSTEPIQSANGFQSGSGATPGLDTDYCGTAPSSPSAGYVYGYCNNKIPLFKNEDGTTFTPTIGIANPSDSQYVSYIDANGVAHRSTPSGSGVGANGTLDFPGGGRASGVLTSIWDADQSGISGGVGVWKGPTFANTSTPTTWTQFIIPQDMDLTKTVYVQEASGNSNGTTGAIRFSIKIGCISAGGSITGNPTFGSTTTSSTITISSGNTQNYTGYDTIDISACASNGLIAQLNVARDNSVGSNLADTAILTDLSIKYSRK